MLQPLVLLKELTAGHIGVAFHQLFILLAELLQIVCGCLALFELPHCPLALLLESLVVSVDFGLLKRHLQHLTFVLLCLLLVELTQLRHFLQKFFSLLFVLLA